ncbi:MAG: U32 family peptidase [Patescibacteria group bacterium]|jgi:putative protease
MNKPELLAPAGSYEKLKTALAFGADAVYCGLPDFSLRVRINSFNLKDLAEAIKYCHDHKKKIYLTLNIYAHNQHLKKLPAYIKFLKANKPDGIIVSDPGIIKILKKELPKIPLHLSTQANCTNWQAAKFWYEQGIKRIILAREVTIAEIKEIRKNVPKLELEYFVHGAMCMSYSGRCILSKWLTGRSANLGDCVQPCRWGYRVSTDDERGQVMEVEEDKHGTYLFNSKDLCLIGHLAELKKAGVTSFKIEGRAKSAYYVAVVVKAYRQAIDKKQPIKNLVKELGTLANRGYTTGFAFGAEKWDNNFQISHQKSSYQFVGEVVKYSKEKGATLIAVHNAIYRGETVEFITPTGKNFRQKLTKIIDTKNDKEVASAHGGHDQIISIKTTEPIPAFSVLRKKLKS